LSADATTRASLASCLRLVTRRNLENFPRSESTPVVDQHHARRFEPIEFGASVGGTQLLRDVGHLLEEGIARLQAFASARTFGSIDNSLRPTGNLQAFDLGIVAIIEMRW